MLEERSYLCGNKNERIVQALGKAGWYEGRKAEISSVLTYYKKWNEVENLAWVRNLNFYYSPNDLANEKDIFNVVKTDEVEALKEDVDYINSKINK